MKNEKLLLHIENIDPKFIEEAELNIQNTKKKSNIIYFVRKFSLICAYTILLVVCMFSTNTNDLNTSKNINKLDFPGFKVTAYSSKTKDQNLTSDYLSNTLPVTLSLNTTTNLATYSPIMSCAPGLPLKFDISDTKYKLSISVDIGNFNKWNISTGIVTECKKKVLCNSGQTYTGHQ